MKKILAKGGKILWPRLKMNDILSEIPNVQKSISKKVEKLYDVYHLKKQLKF